MSRFRKTVRSPSSMPPPPVKSRSFAEMRRDVEKKRLALSTQLIEDDEDFYVPPELSFMNLAANVLSSEPQDDIFIFNSTESLLNYANEDDIQEVLSNDEFVDDLPPISFVDFTIQGVNSYNAEFEVQTNLTDKSICSLGFDVQSSSFFESHNKRHIFLSLINNDAFISHLESEYPQFKKDDFLGDNIVNYKVDFIIQSFLKLLKTDYSSVSFSFDKHKHIKNDLYQKDIFYRNLVDFDPRKCSVYKRDLLRMRIIYLPSGGGKTTLLRRLNLSKLYDIDDLIRDNYDLFLKTKSYVELTNDSNLMNQFFNLAFHLMFPLLKDKILFFNHPNQIPPCYRLLENQLVIFPLDFNYGVKFFNENLYTLLSTYGLIYTLGCYDSYKSIVFKFIKEGIKPFLR